MGSRGAVTEAALLVVLRAVGETDAAPDLAERAVAWFAGAGGGDAADLADETLAGFRADAAPETGVASG